MNLITRAQHGYLDLILIGAFVVAPLVLDFSPGAATLAYVLGGVHLVMTLTTAGLPVVVRGLIPLPLHGLVEAVVGVALSLLGWLAFEGDAGAFYLVIAAVILLTFAVTPYIDRSS